MKRVRVIGAIMMAVVFGFTSCQKDDQPTPAPVASNDFLVNGSAVGAFDLFGFEVGGRVPNTDSLTNRWDFGMRFERIIVNSGASGRGNAGVQVVNQPFDAVTVAPETGYAFDTSATQLAVKPEQWYVYNATTRSFSPIAGRTFIFRTANNKFAKMEILTALPADDNGNLVTPPTRPTRIKYQLRFAFQSNGRNF